MKIFFDNIDVCIKAIQDNKKIEQICAAYSDVILCFCLTNNYHKLYNPAFCTFEMFSVQTLPVLERITEQTRLIICNEVIYLFKNYVLDKLYETLVNCNLDVDNLNITIVQLVDQFTPIVNDLYAACMQ